MNAEEAEKEHPEVDPATEQKLRGPAAGQDDSIPGSGDGVGIGAGTEPNTFEPEEDPEATDGNADS